MTILTTSSQKAFSCSGSRKILLLMIGLCFQFNVLTSTFGLPFQRLSDILPFAIIPWLLLQADLRGTMFRISLRATAMLIVIGLSLFFKSSTESGDLYLTLILMSYYIMALGILPLLRTEEGSAAISIGILIGFLLSSLVLFYTPYGGNLTQYGLGVPLDTSVRFRALFVQDKQGGLWTAGNEAGHVFALAGAAAFYLASRLRVPTVYIGFFLVLIATFTLTNNRGGLIAPVLGLLIITWRKMDLNYYLVIVIALASAAVYYGVGADLPLPDSILSSFDRRFAQDSNASGNFDERLRSGLAGLQLIPTFPFGIGTTARQSEIASLSHGITTPHNGFITLALQSGIGVAIAFLVSIVVVIRRHFQGQKSIVSLLIIFSLASLIFEELTVNQDFLFVFALGIADLTLGSQVDAHVSVPRGALQKRASSSVYSRSIS